jgi:hypothetical protein
MVAFRKNRGKTAAPGGVSRRCQKQFGMDERGKGRLKFSREGREGGEVRRTGIVVESATQTNQAPFRSEIIGNVDGICRPAGAEIYFGLGCYKYAAPDGAMERGLQPASAH